jgi:hypothetical protein
VLAAQVAQLLAAAWEIIPYFPEELLPQLLMAAVLAQVAIADRQAAMAALEEVVLGIQVLQLTALQHKATQAV